MTLAAIPSPSTAVWQLGPIPIRAYALCIVLGIVVGGIIADRRLRQRGAQPWAMVDIATWAVPFGIVGARLYHVITSPQDYFGEGGQPLHAFYIWEGGLGVWGAIAGGVLGGWLACRQLGIPLTVVADAAAPALPISQAIGRIGNWFNNELYGGETTLPWGLKIHQMDRSNPGHALKDQNGNPILEPVLYHPTFLYEALWNVGVAVLVILVDRRVKLGRGRAFALYVMGYTVGRFWIELMRTDEANVILGQRLNVWTSILVFLGALAYFLRVRGPAEFLIPIGLVAPTRPDLVKVPVGAAGEAQDGVSQRDVSGAGESRKPAAPAGYRVVSEERFLAYRETGELPDDDDEAGITRGHDLLDDFADDEPDTEPDEVDDEPDTDEPDEASAADAAPVQDDKDDKPDESGTDRVTKHDS